MKFLVDAHLPFGLVKWLIERGHDAIHTSELPQKNKTEDAEIIQISVEQDRIVVSKDEDFYKHFILKGKPSKILLLTMGNIINKELISLFEENIEQIEHDLQQNKIVELSNDSVTVHF
ncbi:DUF5615 family PIN-like protein [Gracilimonas sp.]|uniref:DUF5615 family PIN-like protein n=1 Tax=Gracilimonas sp. TaxID=1974203 RepID=UPI002871ADFD|nr:DUF5615 family PIN-like protein [Gracilimonas sp.]